MFVQFVDSLDIDIGLASAGFHFNAERQLVGAIGKRQGVSALDGVEVLLDLIHCYRECVADAVQKHIVLTIIFTGEITVTMIQFEYRGCGGLLILLGIKDKLHLGLVYKMIATHLSQSKNHSNVKCSSFRLHRY